MFFFYQGLDFISFIVTFTAISKLIFGDPNAIGGVNWSTRKKNYHLINHKSLAIKCLTCSNSDLGIG